MHEEFASWYEGLSLGQDVEYLESRWRSVEAVVDKATKSTLELLVRLAFRTKIQMSSADVAELRAKFASEATSPGDEELVVLAGAALARAMVGGDDNSSLAATMIATAQCGGLRELALPMDLTDLAERSNRISAESRRLRPSLDVGKAVATALDKTEVANAVRQASEENAGTGIQTLIISINKALATIARRQAAVEAEFHNYTQLQDEELDILWWLHGAYSVDFLKDFTEVPPPFRPLGVARELAALTQVLPGPVAVSALLTRARVAEAPNLTIVAAVQGMPDSWLSMVLEDLSDENISSVTTPILFALSRRKELDGAEGWAPAWSKLTSLPETAQLAPLHFAEAAYREFVLARLG